MCPPESIHLPERQRSRADECKVRNEWASSAIMQEERTTSIALNQRPRIAWRTPFT